MKNLVKAIKRNFNPHFGFPEGFIKIGFRNNIINLKIGHRDIDINEEGKDIGAGSELELKFIIKKVNDESLQKNRN